MQRQACSRTMRGTRSPPVARRISRDLAAAAAHASSGSSSSSGPNSSSTAPPPPTRRGLLAAALAAPAAAGALAAALAAPPPAAAALTLRIQSKSKLKPVAIKAGYLLSVPDSYSVAYDRSDGKEPGTQWFGGNFKTFEVGAMVVATRPVGCRSAGRFLRPSWLHLTLTLPLSQPACNRHATARQTVAIAKTPLSDLGLEALEGRQDLGGLSLDDVVGKLLADTRDNVSHIDLCVMFVCF
jgi:hypothetical protein